MANHFSKLAVKTFLGCATLCLVLVVRSFSQTPTQTSIPWDGPILPVQSGKIILRSHCGRRLTSIPWTRNILVLTHGLKKGDSVWAITKSGFFPARLGNLECFLGECTANYFSIRLETQETIQQDVIAVVKRGYLNQSARPYAPTRVSPPRIPDCTDMLAKIPRPSSTVLQFNFREIVSARKCITFNLGRNVQGPLLQVASKSYDQENGYEVFEVRARILVNAKNQFKATQDVFVDYSTGPLQPVLVFSDGRGSMRVLWWKEEGICCPSKVTLVMSRIHHDGSIQFGKLYSAGGQPCD